MSYSRKHERGHLYPRDDDYDDYGNVYDPPVPSNGGYHQEYGPHDEYDPEDFYGSEYPEDDYHDGYLEHGEGHQDREEGYLSHSAEGVYGDDCANGSDHPYDGSYDYGRRENGRDYCGHGSHARDSMRHHGRHQSKGHHRYASDPDLVDVHRSLDDGNGSNEDEAYQSSPTKLRPRRPTLSLQHPIASLRLLPHLVSHICVGVYHRLTKIRINLFWLLVLGAAIELFYSMATGSMEASLLHDTFEDGRTEAGRAHPAGDPLRGSILHIPPDKSRVSTLPHNISSIIDVLPGAAGDKLRSDIQRIEELQARQKAFRESQREQTERPGEGAAIGVDTSAIHSLDSRAVSAPALTDTTRGIVGTRASSPPATSAARTQNPPVGQVIEEPSKEITYEMAQQRIFDDLDAFNPLAPFKIVPHDSTVAQFLQKSRKFDQAYLIDWLGVLTKESYECNKKNKRLRFSPWRRIACSIHAERVANPPPAESMSKGVMPVIDADYPIYVDVLESVMRASTEYVFAEIGTSYGVWGVRAISAFKQLNPQGSYQYLAVDAKAGNIAEHCEANGISEPVILTRVVNSTKDFMEILERMDDVDLLHIDVSGGEKFMFGERDENDFKADRRILKHLKHKVHRLHVVTSDSATHQALDSMFTGEEWVKVLSHERNRELSKCDKTISQQSEAFKVNTECTTPTKWGPVYIRNGLLGYINPRHATALDRSASAKLAATSRVKGSTEDDDESASDEDEERVQEEAFGANREFAEEAIVKGRKTWVRGPGNAPLPPSRTGVTSLEYDQYDCIEVLIGTEEDDSDSNHRMARNARYQYCTIKFRTGCGIPPCINEGVRNVRWSQPVLYKNFFFDHTKKMQVGDAIARELDRHAKHRGQVVLDVGANTGFFSLFSMKLGYKTYAIDVQPLCSQHAWTSALENHEHDLLEVHNVGLSSEGGHTAMVVDQCKSSFNFNPKENHTEDSSGVETSMVPLQSLSSFVDQHVGLAPIRVVKMDTEGSEIDILRSGMDLFRTRRVHGLLVKLGVRHWDMLGTTLEEGIAVLEELRILFTEVYVFSDPDLPKGKLVHEVKPWNMPSHIRNPVYTINSIGKLVRDRYEKSQDCNMYFTLGKVENVGGKLPEPSDVLSELSDVPEDGEELISNDGDIDIPGLSSELKEFFHIKTPKVGELLSGGPKGHKSRFKWLPKNQVQCENVTVGVDEDGTVATQSVNFDFCGVRYIKSCGEKFCSSISKGVRTPWPYPVVDSTYFQQKDHLSQMSAIFLSILDAESHQRSEVVFDIGANTGWFSQIAVKLGYKVHAVDEYPLCVLHVVTNARKNVVTENVLVHNLILSTQSLGLWKDVPVDRCEYGNMGAESRGEAHQAASFPHIDDVGGGRNSTTFDRVTSANSTTQEELMQAGVELQTTGEAHQGLENDTVLVPSVPVGRTSLDSFSKEVLISGETVRLLRVDAYGSEIDILQSGMTLFRQGMVYSLLLAIRAESWLPKTEQREKDLVEVIEQVKNLFEDTYVLMSPDLPVGKYVYDIGSKRYPKGVQGPIFAIDSVRSVIRDRIEKGQPLFMWFRKPMLE
mmetsp:Transcript_1601/g.5584  ORF Transcript_1601/g.5584 Transcript_1601/m.5584 type:complete len:1565 (-) Transcript_1601:1450-6144(-)